MPKTILDILIKNGLATDDAADTIKKEVKEKQKPLEDILYSRGFKENDIAEAKGELTGFPVKPFALDHLPAEVLQDIPEESAAHYKIAPLGKHEGYFDVGALNPADQETQGAIKFIAARKNLPVRIFIITPSDFENIMAQYKNLSEEVTKALGEFKKEYEAREDIKFKTSEPAKLTEEAPVTKMMGVIMRHAVEGSASDIHIEPGQDKVRVRFRVDGELHTSLMLPKNIHSAIITRIKVMTSLKIDETRIPQDGRFRVEVNGRDIDFRVSTFPTAYGEKVAIRILDPSAGISTLPELGFEGRNLKLLEESIRKPYGLILITGPTGSGKSTTLYTILQILNQERANIVSLEDPVEYYIQGVNQSQIHPEIGYDFATGLRHILRQDPDIIMVGEIRDKETAALAIHAALTGHLVLSTLHTNNALGVIPRLIDMGIDPYLIPTTLILAVAQRLVRKLCSDSKKEMKVSGRVKDVLNQEIEKMPSALRDAMKKSIPQEIYQPATSPACPRGTRGRSGVFEPLATTPALEKIILSSPSESKIQEEARRQNMITMRQDGIQKVLKGVIGLEELLEAV